MILFFRVHPRFVEPSVWLNEVFDQ